MIHPGIQFGKSVDVGRESIMFDGRPGFGLCDKRRVGQIQVRMTTTSSTTVVVVMIVIVVVNVVTMITPGRETWCGGIIRMSCHG